MGRFDRPACMMDPHSDQSLEIHRMKLRLLATTLAALTLVAGTASAQDTSSEKGKLSYALGYDLGRNLVESGESIDVNTVIKAVQDGYAKKEPAVPVDQLRSAVQNMQQRQMAKAKAEFDKAAAANRSEEHTSELQSLMRISYAVFCLKKNKQ